jgi:hypothetical protein
VESAHSARPLGVISQESTQCSLSEIGLRAALSRTLKLTEGAAIGPAGCNEQACRMEQRNTQRTMLRALFTRNSSRKSAHKTLRIEKAKRRRRSKHAILRDAGMAWPGMAWHGIALLCRDFAQGGPSASCVRVRACVRASARSGARTSKADGRLSGHGGSGAPLGATVDAEERRDGR